MWRLIEKKKFPPTRHMRYCCDVLKEDGGSGRVCVLGVRAAESTRRRDRFAPLTEWNGARTRLHDNDDILKQVQSCTLKGKITISPLYYWQDQDIWDFIRDRKMPYCELYDQGFERLGCIGCPLAKQREREKEFSMWPKFRDAYVRAFQRLIDVGRFTNIGMFSGEEVMQWWLDDRTQDKPIDGQIEMEGL